MSKSRVAGRCLHVAELNYLQPKTKASCARIAERIERTDCASTSWTYRATDLSCAEFHRHVIPVFRGAQHAPEASAVDFSILNIASSVTFMPRSDGARWRIRLPNGHLGMMLPEFAALQRAGSRKLRETAVSSAFRQLIFYYGQDRFSSGCKRMRPSRAARWAIQEWCGVLRGRTNTNHLSKGEYPIHE